jgi:ABC-type dipeptide/oligopeptide/nickel transport system permease component
MFEKVHERLRSEARWTLTLLALAAACAGAAAIALGFLCAAGFVFALDHLGVVYACLIATGVFLAAALIFLAGYAILAARRRRKERERAAAEARSLSALADPRLVLLAFRVVQAVGVRRLIPLLAVGGAAFALASWARPGRSDAVARAGGTNEQTASASSRSRRSR